MGFKPTEVPARLFVDDLAGEVSLLSMQPAYRRQVLERSDNAYEQ